MDSRRTFLQKTLTLTGSLIFANQFSFAQQAEDSVMTVLGPIDRSLLGNTLIHEHILVDFIGAAKSNSLRWNRKTVIQKVLPFLLEAKATGIDTVVDCTPNYLGRDVLLLRELSEKTGLNIVTNTGYYGGSDHKYLPAHAFAETTQRLSERWFNEYAEGIEGSGIKPGFIKISVNDSKLSDVSKKLISAAALTHLKTGLTIASHTGPFIPAMEQVQILKTLGVDPSAFIWVHAQTETDWEKYVQAAKLGAWVSLDGLSDSNVAQYVKMVLFMKDQNCLHRTLISHDAGWYDPEKEEGGNIRGYTTLVKKFIPAIQANDFGDREIDQLIKQNPKEVFRISVRKAESK